MVIASPGIEIDSPQCTPARYGLLSVAEIEDRDDSHWGLGVYHEQESCDDLTVRTIRCLDPGTDTPKPLDGALDYPESDPFTIVAPFTCSTAGLPLSEAWDHARTRLEQSEARTLEETFWNGEDGLGNSIRASLGQNLGVVDLTPGAGAVSVTDGLALLEDWAGDNMPCGPVVHTPRGIATYLKERNLISPSGNLMYAEGTGSRVVVGGGYTATGPLGGGSNEVQTVRVTPGAAPSGTFTLTFDGQTTAPIAYNATAGQIEAALAALSNVDPGDITATGGPVDAADVVLTFDGQYRHENVSQITADGTGLTDATVDTATTSEGVPDTTLPTGAGEGWMFISSGIKVVRGPIFFTPDQGDLGAATDRIVNDITVFAERNYAILLGCGVAAVRVLLQGL